MNPTLQKILMALLATVLVTIKTDYGAYRQAVDAAAASNEPLPAFNWRLFATRLLDAAIGAVVVGGGWSVVVQAS